MQNTITLDDVLASSKKFGRKGVLKPDTKKTRDLKTLNPKSKYDTTYIPLLFKHVNGKEMPVKIRFSEQIVASSAKAPQGSDEEGIPKHMNLSFMKLKREDIEGGDYVPKNKSTVELQEIENKRVSDNIDRYIETNIMFLDVLDIIDESYKAVCAEIISQESSFPFRIRKGRDQKDITVHTIKQTTRLNQETNKDEILDSPIFRLKIPVCKKDGRIGIWSNYKDEFKPTVYDARKMTKKNNYQPVPAMVKIDGKLKDLDVNNASSFITYKSLIGGQIMFECIVASKFGLSMNNSFYELFVYRHKAKAIQSTISREEIMRMRGGGSEEEESDNETVVEVKTEQNSDDEEPVEVKVNTSPVDSDDEADVAEVVNSVESVELSENGVVDAESKKKPRGRKPSAKSGK
jgi:hypothetical protein